MKRGYLALGLLLAFGVLETGARLAQPWLARTTPAYYFRTYLRALLRKDPELIWVGVPGATAEIANGAGETIPYKLNSLGWRDDEFLLLRNPANALALGDSFTFGTGVRAPDRYTERLEKMFRGLDVWNLGVMGYAPDQELLLAERWFPPVPWRFVILQLANNDLADVARHEWRGLHATTGVPSALADSISRRLVTDVSEAWNLFAYFAILGSEIPSHARLEEGLGRLLFSVRETAKLSRQRGIPLFVLQASDWGEGAYGAKIAGQYRDGVQNLAREEGFVFLEAGPQELLPAPDSHWTAAAHARVAEQLRPLVKAALFPPVGPKH